MSRVIEIYGRDDCRFCAAAVAHCKRRDYPHVYHDMTNDPALQAALVDRINEVPATVPQIFIGEHHIGGFDDLKAADDAIQQIIGGN
jgi:glutaredoxin 3